MIGYSCMYAWWRLTSLNELLWFPFMTHFHHHSIRRQCVMQVLKLHSIPDLINLGRCKRIWRCFPTDYWRLYRTQPLIVYCLLWAFKCTSISFRYQKNWITGTYRHHYSSISEFRRVVNVVFFLWTIPRRLNFMCRRFATLCSIFIGGVNKNNRDAGK